MDLKENYTISDLFKKVADGSINELEGKKLSFGGFVRFNRFSGNIGFVSINDGSCFDNLQIVYTDNMADAMKAKLGASLLVSGTFHVTPTAKQPFELTAEEVKLTGDVDDSYPLQKNKMSFLMFQLIFLLNM